MTLQPGLSGVSRGGAAQLHSERDSHVPLVCNHPSAFPPPCAVPQGRPAVDGAGRGLLELRCLSESSLRSRHRFSPRVCSLPPAAQPRCGRLRPSASLQLHRQAGPPIPSYTHPPVLLAVRCAGHHRPCADRIRREGWPGFVFSAGPHPLLRGGTASQVPTSPVPIFNWSAIEARAHPGLGQSREDLGWGRGSEGAPPEAAAFWKRHYAR